MKQMVETATRQLNEAVSNPIAHLRTYALTVSPVAHQEDICASNLFDHCIGDYIRGQLKVGRSEQNNICMAGWGSV